MKRLIALTGLVSVEKAEIAQALAHHYATQGSTVTLIDNIARFAIESETAIRLNGDIAHYLAPTLDHIASDVVVLAAAETANPDDLFTALDALHAEYAVYTLALIDTRTCDCFPALRQALETYADAVIQLPTEFDTVLEALG